MAKKGSGSDSGKRGSGGHRYPAIMLRLHTRMRAQLEKLVEQHASNLSAEIRTAVREYLERAGLWPPAASDQ